MKPPGSTLSAANRPTNQLASHLARLSQSPRNHLRNLIGLTNKLTMDTTADNSTHAVVRRVPGVDPRVTEALLQAQDGVLDASVWFNEGDLAAHVTVRDDAGWTVRELQAVCLENIGIHQTPRTVLMVSARPTAGVSAPLRAA